jgi:long-chain fatty acid transport protein
MQGFDRRSRFRAHARVLLFVAVLPGLAARVAGAQVPVESSGGTRALGMAGAFTAVADDATAGWWNPAGLSSLLADAVLEGGADDLTAHTDRSLV